mgnify:CR=1 FL=1
MIITLNQGDLTTMEAVALEIRVLCGTLWVTESGRPEDIVIRAGESRVVGQGGKLVLEPLGQSASYFLGARRAPACLRLPADADCA